MTRLLPAVRERTGEEPPRRSVESGDERSSRRALRKALLGLGLLGLAYAASRRAGSGEPALSPDEALETGGDAAPGDEGGPSFGEPAASEVDSEPLPAEDVPSTDIAERAEEDVREEPAPPGEMAVDEDVVEEIVDENEVGAPDDETASGREDEAEGDSDRGRT